ncbi:MAG: rhomboid family intramembrane serine protease [Chloroflexaceae bacterium]|nr:rhomboid family intramembrane serine protease [Chloroflexaceae bacterium]
MAQSGVMRIWNTSTPAVRVIALINVMLFALPTIIDMLGFSFAGVTVSDLLLIWGAKNNIAIAAGDQYYRFITMMFLHAGLLHLLFNTMALVSIGTDIEQLCGTQRFLGIYLVGGFAGGVASYVYTANPAVGASGAIFALIGAELIYILRNRRLYGDQTKQLLANVGFTALLNIGIGFTVPNIDNMAHIGGLCGGFICGLLLTPRVVPVLYADGSVVPAKQTLSWGWYGVIAVIVGLVGVVMSVVPAMDLG